jgi:dipeptidyl aminopeptidase/acylaminoacyl peptidase
MNYRRWAGALALVCATGFAASAQENTKTSGPKLLTPEGSLNVRSISDLQFSPDGNRVVFVVTEPAKGEGRARHIWVFDKTSNAVRQFTYSAKSETSPRWSPDGKQLAFISSREGDDEQIFLMPASGGEASATTKGKRSVEEFVWSPDGKQIAFLAPETNSEAEEKKLKDKNDARVKDKDDKHTGIWVTTLASGETKRLTKPNLQVKEIAWQPNSDILTFVGTDHPESDQDTDRIFGIRVADGVVKVLITPHGPVGRLRPSASGKSFGYVGCREDGPSPHDLMIADVNAQAARNLTGATLDRPIREFQWMQDGGIMALYVDGFRGKFVSFTASGGTNELPSAKLPSVAGFAVSNAGEVALVGQSATQPEELWLWDQKGEAKQVSHLNDTWKEFALGTPEIYEYKSFDGVEIEAALLKPANYDGKSKVPLIALIHGGPTGEWSDSIDTWGQLLAARGYAVFYPNIRGSSGYGEKFVEMNRGDWGGADFKDVMAGVDDLIAKKIADPEKLAIGGWSYGGYMSEWAITQTTRFKAAVSGAGLSNLISEYGTERGPSYDEWFYGVPYEPDKLTAFLNSSPFVYLKNAKTPTLILQGDSDPVDPLGQSQELYRGLKHYGVEAEFVEYPREPHGFHEEKHLLDRLNRILAWYDKYLKAAAN